MDWTTLLVGAVGGAGAGFLSSLVSPWATRRAEEAQIRRKSKRELVDQGRALVAEATRDGWFWRHTAEDPRYWKLRPHLPPKVRARYEEPMPPGTADSGKEHRELARAVDDLEHRWGLI